MDVSHALTPLQSTLEDLALKRCDLKTVIYDDLLFCMINYQYQYYVNHLMIDNNHQKNK